MQKKYQDPSAETSTAVKTIELWTAHKLKGPYKWERPTHNSSPATHDAHGREGAAYAAQSECVCLFSGCANIEDSEQKTKHTI